MLEIGELLASSVFQKIEIGHLCNALTTDVPVGPILGSQEEKSLTT